MKPYASVVASLLVLSLTNVAKAGDSSFEVAGLFGYGSAPLNGSTEANNFGPGFGLRGGATIGKFWLGATATYQFGIPDYDAHYNQSGDLQSGNYCLSVFGIGGELGASLRFGQVVLRPYVWTGALIYVQSPLSDFTPLEVQGPLVRFAVAPSFHFDYQLPRSPLFLGGDIRVNVLVPGTAPTFKYDGAHFPLAGWTSEEHLTANISAFAVVGARF
ncbi:MAG TPA: hypothetical protein VGH28_08045 [Polyangiaceae bacterium]|jgi:hypothetical protein